MGKIAVVGGGAAGMIAAIFAARNGNHVEVFEKNEKLGKKLYITGKGRCNLTVVFMGLRTKRRWTFFGESASE